VTTTAYERRPPAEDDAPPPAPFDRKLTPAENERLLRLWRAGTSAHDIATLLRIRYARVEQLVHGGPGS
jgi:hypothetical protein